MTRPAVPEGPERRLFALIDGLARGMALVGGLVLLALVVLTCLSVLGRGLDTLAHADGLARIAPPLASALRAMAPGPVPGDYELVEAGVAFAIFAFLPLCQLRGAHATVDVATARLPAPAIRTLVALWDAVLAAVLVLIAFRLAEGMQDKMRYAETTFILQFPVWWSYALSLAGAGVAALVGVYCALSRLLGLLVRRLDLPTRTGAGH